MGSYNWFLFIICGIFILSSVIVILKKGFWVGLTSACATILACCFAIRYDVFVGNRLKIIEYYDTFISLLITMVAGSAIFGILATQGINIPSFFGDGSKKKKGKSPDLFADLALIVSLIVLSVVAVGFTGKIAMKGNQEEVKVIGEMSEDAKAKEGSSLALAVKNFDLKLQTLSDSSKRWFSIPLQISLVLILYLWGQTGAWVALDSNKNKNIHKPVVWKLIFIFLYPIGLFAGILLPIFIVDALIAPILYFVPALIYAHLRNKNLPYDEQVLTKEHLGKLLSSVLKSKKKKSKKDAVVQYSTIDLAGYGKEVPKEKIKERTEAARNLPGYRAACDLVNHALMRRAEYFQLDNNGGQTSLKYQIDGVWNPVTELYKRSLTDQDYQMLLAVFKSLIGGNPEVNNARQAGQFYIEYDKVKGKKRKMAARILIQPKGTFEEIHVQFERLAVRFGSFEKMRVLPHRANQIKELLKNTRGLIVFAAPPGQGLRNLTDVSLYEMDRFTRDTSAVEDIRHPYMTIENIVMTTYDSAQKETPDSKLTDVFFKEPKVLVLRDMVNKETFTHCCQEIQNERLIITTLRAKNSSQAIMTLLKSGIDPKLLADSLTAVITQRLVRSLCATCKEEIPATEEMCRRLGIPPGRVKSFYRRRLHEQPEPGKKDTYVPCKDCMEIGYKGRLGIYDIIVINDEIRQIMMTNPSEAAIQRAAMKAGGGSFTPDGIRLIAEGMTTYEELARVLKE